MSSTDPLPAWARRLTELRRARMWVESDLAQELKKLRPDLPSVRSLTLMIRSDWEAGRHRPCPRYRLLLAAVFDVDEEQLFPPVHVPVRGGSVEPSPVPHATDDDVERRELLQAAAFCMGAGAVGPIEPLRMLVEVALACEPRDLADWHLTCDDHLHGIRTRPPGQVRGDLAVDLLVLGRQMRTADARDIAELQRVRAALSTLYANALTRLAEHGTAIRWWQVARNAADASGDLQLRLGVRATETGYGLSSSQRDAATVLRLTQDALRIAGDRPSLGKALVVCSQAKALSALGRHGEARHALIVGGDLFADAVEPKGIMPGYWRGGQQHYGELVVHAAAGEESKVEVASDRALAIINHTADRQYVPQIRLREAQCTVVNGGIDTGTRRAAEILDALPPGQRGHMVIETALVVLRAVPLDQRDRPPVRELRALTTGSGLS